MRRYTSLLNIDKAKRWTCAHTDERTLLQLVASLHRRQPEWFE